MINEIKSLLNKNKSISEISEILKIKRTTLYGILKRHNIPYITKKGRPEGSYDKKKRKRQTRKIIGGSHHSDVDKFIQSAMTEVRREIKTEKDFNAKIF